MTKHFAICHLHLEELGHAIKLPFKCSPAKTGTSPPMGDIFQGQSTSCWTAPLHQHNNS